MIKHVGRIAILGIAGISFVAGACDGRITPSGVRPASQAATSAASAGAPTPLSEGEATAQALGEATLDSFDDYPLLWLGASYDSDGDGAGDKPLEGADVHNYAARYDPLRGSQIAPEIRSFSMGYGFCTIPPNKSQCNVPITITFYPPDNQLPPLVGVTGHTTVRGVDAAIYDSGNLWIQTADFAVTISPAFARPGDDRLQQSLRMANQLYGANAKAAGITKDTDFRPPPPPPPTPFPTDPAAPPTRTPTPFPIVTPAPTDAIPTPEVSTAVSAPAGQ